MRNAAVLYLCAAVFGLVVGGADQYLGSRVTLGPWAASVSAMSAPWLLLPFVFGSTQLERRRAILVGLIATVAALAGYFALTLSPWEGVALGRFPGDLVALARSNLRNIVGGMVTGPLFGALGWRWRTSHSRAGAGLLAAAFCLEPVARLAVGQLSSPAVMWGIEVALGTALAGYFAVVGAARRQAGRATVGMGP